MFIYKLELELHEKVFFASREISNVFITEEVIGNYALNYAFGFCPSPYHSEGVHSPSYKEDFARMNDKGVYLTPATPIGTVKTEMERFNALTESYWYAMVCNGVAPNLENKKEKYRPVNFPQQGYIRSLSRGNKFHLFLLSKEEVDIPAYIRLGKWMSKVKVTVISKTETDKKHVLNKTVFPYFLNPLDISDEIDVLFFSSVNVPPVPLIHNVHLSGEFYKLHDEYIPVNLEYKF